MNERTDFGKYGKAFQEGLCQLIFEDRPFADQITEVLDIKFLELEYLRVFTRKIIQYRVKYGTHPSCQVMGTILKTELENENDITKKQVSDYFEKIQITALEDDEYIKETSLDFCKKQSLKIYQRGSESSFNII